MIRARLAPVARTAPEASRRKGFALAAALLSVMLIGALMASVFFAAMEDARIGSVSGAKQTALSAAESAIELSVRNWQGSASDPIGVEGTRSTTVDAFGTPVAVSVTRLDSAVYWIVADAGRVSSGVSATRRIGVFVLVHMRPDGSIAVDRMPERWWSELF